MEIPATINNIKITTIDRKFYCESEYVVIGNNIERIEKGAFNHGWSIPFIFCEKNENSNYELFPPRNTKIIYNYKKLKEKDNFYFSINNNEATLEAYCGEEKDIYIPKEIDRIRITKLSPLCLRIPVEARIYIPRSIKFNKVKDFKKIFGFSKRGDIEIVRY